MTEKNKAERFAKFLATLGNSHSIVPMPPKVTRIKIFKASWIEEIESSINEWLTNNPQITIVNIQTHAASMYDFYASSQPPQICNQWNEYIWTIIYKDYGNYDGNI